MPPQAANHSLVRPALRLAVDVPQGWAFRDLGGDVVLEIYARTPHPSAPQAAPAENAAARPSLAVIQVVAINREGVSLDDWATQAIKDSQELQSDLEVTSRTKTQLSDGREALAITLKNPRGMQPLIQKMLLAVTDRRAYGLLATAPESEMAAAEAAVKKCFDSFVVW